jgi:hypothetical protein
LLSGGSVESGERRRRWGHRFQAVRWPAQGVKRVRDEYRSQRSLTKCRSWDVVYASGWIVVKEHLVWPPATANGLPLEKLSRRKALIVRPNPRARARTVRDRGL